MVKLKSPIKPLHETTAQHVHRVCGESFADRDLGHPVLKGMGITVLALGILVIGVMVISLVMNLLQAYGDRILESMPGK